MDIANDEYLNNAILDRDMGKVDEENHFNIYNAIIVTVFFFFVFVWFNIAFDIINLKTNSEYEFFNMDLDPSKTKKQLQDIKFNVLRTNLFFAVLWTIFTICVYIAYKDKLDQ